MRYDDGFVAYINGREVASANAPGACAMELPSHDVSSRQSRRAVSKLRRGRRDLPPANWRERAGHPWPESGRRLGHADFARVGRLVDRSGRARTNWATSTSPRRATPTAPATSRDSSISPTFSVPHGYYSSPVSVELAAQPGTIIVYTTDGSTPAVNASLTPTNGTLYAGPIDVTSTTTIRAMAFKADYKTVVRHGQHLSVPRRRDRSVAHGRTSCGLACQRRRQWPADELRHRPRHHRASTAQRP